MLGIDGVAVGSLVVGASTILVTILGAVAHLSFKGGSFMTATKTHLDTLDSQIGSVATDVSAVTQTVRTMADDMEHVRDAVSSVATKTEEVADRTEHLHECFETRQKESAVSSGRVEKKVDDHIEADATALAKLDEGVSTVVGAIGDIATQLTDHIAAEAPVLAQIAEQQATG